MISVERFRELTLAMADTTAAPHMDRVAFRTPQRIFATLGNDGAVNFKLPEQLQVLLVSARSKAFSPVPGGWGAQGWTRCLLAEASEGDIRDALAGAHALAQVKAGSSKKSTAKPANQTKKKSSTKR